MKRKIAILALDSNQYETAYKLVDDLAKFRLADEVTVFTKANDAPFDMTGKFCINVSIPDEYDTDPKIRNWVNSFMQKSSQPAKYLHVLESSTELLSDPSQFIDDLEKMMEVLDYPVWFSTVSDYCNFVYSKYNPRLEVRLDDPKYDKLQLGDALLFTSNSNTQWIAYDMENVTSSQLHFDESFTIPMFYIIEFLARRTAERKDGQLFFMNMYMTVKSELGIFRPTVNSAPIRDMKKFETEDTVFKSKSICTTPADGDDVMKALYSKLNAILTTYNETSI